MVRESIDWPEWWHWELDVGSPHLAKRMRDRSLNEADVRDMLERAHALAPNHEPGRWIAVSRMRGVDWEIILEPIMDEQILAIVTAYPTGR